MSLRDHIAAVAYALRFAFLYCLLPILVACLVLMWVTR